MTPTLSNVVIVNDFGYVNGGSSQVALSSAIALAESGTSVTILAAAGPPLPQLASTKNLRLILTGQHEIATDPSRLRAASQGLWNWQAAAALAHILDELDPSQSVVHFHGWTKALSSSVIKITLDRHFPAVVTLHEYFTACPIGSFYNHQRGKICALDPLSRNCVLENCDPRSYRDKMWRVARQFVQRDIAKVPARVSEFISLSGMSEQILARTLPSTARLHRVNNPIDIVAHPLINVNLNHDFVFVGRLSPEKGSMLFAAAAHSAGVKSVFVGDGICATDIRSINSDAEVTGWLTPERVRERLRRARAIVFPSLWYETDGLFVTEAAALGIPAIISDATVTRERVVDGRTGLHFKSGDLASLTHALTSIKEGDKAAILGAEAYCQYWDSPRAMSRHVDDLISVYRKVIRDAA